MDQQGQQRQHLTTEVVHNSIQLPHDETPYLAESTNAAPSARVRSFRTQDFHQLLPLGIQQLRQVQLSLRQKDFWANQLEEAQGTMDFSNHSFPLTGIEKIMKLDEDVHLISADAPILFARACEMFIMDLTLRSWNHTEERYGNTLERDDISEAIESNLYFDFLLEIMHRDDVEEDVNVQPSGGAIPIGAIPVSWRPPPLDILNSAIGAPRQVGYSSANTPNCATAQPTWPVPRVFLNLLQQKPSEGQPPSDA